MFVFSELAAHRHTVRHCPVISTGLGRASTKEHRSTVSSLKLYTLAVFSSRSCHCRLWPSAAAHFLLLFFSPFFPYAHLPTWRSRRERRRGSRSNMQRCQTDYPAAWRVGQQRGDISVYLSPQHAESVITPGLLPVGVETGFQSILIHNQQGFPFQLNSHAGTLHVLSSMQILLDFPRIWADFLPWIFLYKCL